MEWNIKKTPEGFNKRGKIVSKRRDKLAKGQNTLEKLGYKLTKAKFKLFTKKEREK